MLGDPPARVVDVYVRCYLPDLPPCCAHSLELKRSPTTTRVSIIGWTRACLFSPKRYPTKIDQQH
jgi:hypothetical protein